MYFKSRILEVVMILTLVIAIMLIGVLTYVRRDTTVFVLSSAFGTLSGTLDECLEYSKLSTEFSISMIDAKGITVIFDNYNKEANHHDTLVKTI